MADEYYNNKIVTTDGDVLMDLTQDTATPETVLEGETFHQKSGAPAVGTYRPSDEIEARLRATVGHSSINLFNEKYRQGSAGNLTITTAVTSKTIIPTTIGQKHIFHNFNQDYAYVIYGLNSAGVSELLSGKIVSTSNRLFDSGYIRQFKYVYENNISGLVAYIIMIRKPQTSGGSNWIDITPNSIDQNIIMVTEYPVSSDIFVPYQEPTDSLIEIKTRAYLTSTVGHACKNLLNLKNLSSATHNGVTWTVDPVAGTITANGTATATSQYMDVRFTLSEGNYYFSGCPSGGGSSTYDVYTWDYITKSRPKKWNGSTTAPSDFDGTKIQLKVVNNHEYGLTCRIKPGVTVNNLVFKPMVWDGSISDDTFEPYVIPTDKAKQDKPVMLYDAGESSVGVHSVTGLSNLTQYSELHITLFSPLNGDEPDNGITHTIVRPFIFPYNPENQSSFFDCWIMAFIDGAFVFKRVGIYVGATNTEVRISGEIDEQTGKPISIPSNHYIYIKRIVGIP